MNRSAVDRVASHHADADYRALFDANPVPMWVRDRDSVAMLAVNGAALEQYGYTQEEFLALEPGQLFASGEGAAERLLDLRHLSGVEVRVIETQHRKKSGEVIDVEISSTPITFDARPAHLVLAHDVTARNRLERQLLEAQKMEAIGQLAGGLAHDFNNMLTVVNSYGSLLLDDVPQTDRRWEYIDQIVSATDRAAALTRQLLAFSRHQVFDLKILDLNVIVRDIEKMLRRIITESIQFRLRLEPHVGAVHADAGQLEQVIVNLVVNARDAMPKGGELTISTANVDSAPADAPAAIRAHQRPWVVLSVSDTGVGMDEQTRLRVFEPFFTTKERGSGTGLGLSTALGVVEQSGGFMRVRSEPGRGTTFESYLPRVAGAVEAGSTEQEQLKRLRGTERVLLVEDEDAVRRVVMRVLTGLGYVVIEARDGREALQTARQLRAAPQLVVTDMVMPKMSGRDLVTALRELWPTLRVLFMSGYSSDVVADQSALAAGASFVGKPFRPAELAAKVREALDAPAPLG